MDLSTGTQIGSYTILRLLGRGGMGEVHCARDEKLGREVALKFVRIDQANEESEARFRREARLLAALNHPNIAAIYGLEEVGGLRFFVMELVPGHSLNDALAQGPQTLQRTLFLSRQIALALQAAHQKGIIHRDIKPANIRITPDDAVKVLDFGLAKSLAAPAPIAMAQQTVTFDETKSGMILGTPSYMSPEQARGQPADHRTDVWSFTCVLFEMLTGRRPFMGGTVSDVIASILAREPEFSILPAALAPRMRKLLERGLEKDAAKRIDDFALIVRELDEIEKGIGQLLHDEEIRTDKTVGALLVEETLDEPILTVQKAPPAERQSSRYKVLPDSNKETASAPPPRRRRWPWVALILLIVLPLFCCPVGWYGLQSGFSWFTEMWSSTPFSFSGPSNTIAVLAFDSGNPFDKSGATVAEGINQHLSEKAPELRVTAHSAAVKYGSDPRHAAAFLRVRWVVTGKIESTAKGPIMSAELVDVRTVTAVWRKRYAATSLRDDAVAQDIAQKVRKAVEKNR